MSARLVSSAIVFPCLVHLVILQVSFRSSIFVFGSVTTSSSVNSSSCPPSAFTTSSKFFIEVALVVPVAVEVPTSSPVLSLLSDRVELMFAPELISQYDSCKYVVSIVQGLMR